MMREHQIDAAGMYIERRAEELNRHHRALDMPPRPPRSDHRIPRWFTRLRSLPQRKIASIILLVLIHLNPRARNHTAEIVMRKLPVPGKRRDFEIHRSIA